MIFYHAYPRKAVVFPVFAFSLIILVFFLGLLEDVWKASFTVCYLSIGGDFRFQALKGGDLAFLSVHTRSPIRSRLLSFPWSGGVKGLLGIKQTIDFPSAVYEIVVYFKSK